MILFLQIMAILFMATLMFVAVWGFITLNQILGQTKYKNYLLERLTQNIYMLSVNSTVGPKESNSRQKKEAENHSEE